MLRAVGDPICRMPTVFSSAGVPGATNPGMRTKRTSACAMASGASRVATVQIRALVSRFIRFVPPRPILRRSAWARSTKISPRRRAAPPPPPPGGAARHDRSRRRAAGTAAVAASGSRRRRRPRAGRARTTSAPEVDVYVATLELLLQEREQRLHAAVDAAALDRKAVMIHRDLVRDLLPGREERDVRRVGRRVRPCGLAGPAEEDVE